MSQQTDAQLTTEANVIGNETAEGANTADRVRDLLVNLIDSKPNNGSYTNPFPQFTTSTSTTDYVGTPNPAITAYATGQRFQVKVHATSTGSATLNLNTLGAKKIFTDPTTQAGADDLVINQIYIFFYDAALDSATGGFLMVGGSGGGAGQSLFLGVYADESALNSAHPDAEPGSYAYVDPDGTTNAKLYIWDDDDEEWLFVGDISVSLWNDTTPGTVERSTAGGSSESENIATQAGAGGSTGLSADRAPSEVGLKDMLIKLFNTAVTWVAKMTFTAAPRFNSTTASNFLTVDSNKDLTSVAAATQAEMITGTDNTKVVTPLAVESKRSILLTSFSNNATGSSTIDCGSKQEVTVVYNTTVTGAITIAVSNATNLEILNVIIPITGANIAITTPSTTRMSRYNEVSSGDGWYQSTKILQVSSVGTADLHELSFKRASTSPTFLLRYDGPARA